MLNNTPSLSDTGDNSNLLRVQLSDSVQNELGLSQEEKNGCIEVINSLTLAELKYLSDNYSNISIFEALKAKWLADFNSDFSGSIEAFTKLGEIASSVEQNLRNNRTEYIKEIEQNDIDPNIDSLLDNI